MGICQSTPSSDGFEAVTVLEVPAICENLQELFPDQPPRGMGWRKDLPDARDLYFSVEEHSLIKGKELPSSVDLRCLETFSIYDQGHLGSCTANAIAASFRCQQLQEKLEDLRPSRLFIYYCERELEGSTGKDAGARLRDGMKVLHKMGACDESQWPYDIEKFTEKPPPECYDAASKHCCVKYARVWPLLPCFKACLAAGYPIIFGFVVFEDFMKGETRKTGKMAFPPQGKPLGGHAVQACGYDDARECFIIRNSWGEEWGDNGYFYMPYKYMAHPVLCHDFWAVQWVAGAEFPTKPSHRCWPKACPGLSPGLGC